MSSLLAWRSEQELEKNPRFALERVASVLSVLPKQVEPAWLEGLTRSTVIVLGASERGAALFMRPSPDNAQHLRFLGARPPEAADASALLELVRRASGDIEVELLGALSPIEAPCHVVLPVVARLTSMDGGARLCAAHAGGLFLPFCDLANEQWLRAQPLEDGQSYSWSWQHPSGALSSVPAMVWRCLLELVAPGWDTELDSVPLFYGRNSL